VNLLDSLLDAIVRLDGDALVMHVGEKPYVVTTSEGTNQFRGPLAWGQVELSTRVLTSDAVAGMLGQILPLDQRSALEEYGATEYQVTAANHPDERFTVVAARGGDDIWVEMRRQPILSADAAAVIAELRHDDTAHVADVDVPEPAPVEVIAPSAAIEEITPVAEVEDVSAPLEVEEIPAHEAEAVQQPAIEPVYAAAAVAEISVPVATIVEPSPVTRTTPDMDRQDLPLSEYDADDEIGEPTSIDDPDRDFAEELLNAEPDYEGAALAGGQDWGDDVMTEGELGELLRATAAAVIAGEINPDDSVNIEAVAREFAPAAQTAAEPPAPALGLVAVAAAETASVGIVAVETPEPVRPAASSHHVARATEELPALVEYQIARDGTNASSDAPITETIPAPEPMPEPEDALEPVLVSEPAFVLSAPSFDGDDDSGPIDAEETTTTIIMNDEREKMAASAGDAGRDGDDATQSRPAAVVLPLTRQPKVESGGESRASVATTVQRLLRLAAARGAGTVYVVADTAPLVRVDGEFSTLEGEPALTAAFVERLVAEVAPATRGAAPSAEWLIDVPEIGRVRCVTFRDHRGPGVIFRMVPSRAIAAEQLGLSAEVQGLGSEADGLVLVTGARASGKSTLLTSFVDLINQSRSDHIISIESEIGFVHEPKRSFISQREVRGEEALLAAVRSACREEPDVLVIEDLRTQELATLALDAAESGRLVFASVPGLSIPAAIERLIELYPPDRREKVQASLASTLRGVVSQVLLRKLKGGRIAAREVLFNTPPVAGALMEGKTFQLSAALENGRAAGMISFAESLASLVREGIVHPAHAYRKAPNHEQFLAALRRTGVDATIAERLG